MKRDDSARALKTDSEGAGNSTIEVVSALLAERQKYEAWINALDARRADSSAHVFTRVHADYVSRLDAVAAQLATHADALYREVSNLSAQIVALDGEQQRAADERAEAELRAHVGELSSGEWERVSADIDARLGDLATRRGAVEASLQQTKELRDGALSVSPSSSGAPRLAEALPTPELFEAPVIESMPAPPPSVSVPPAPVAEQASLPIDDLLPLPPEESEQASPEELIPEPVAETKAPAPSPRRSASRRSNGFDELAFLSSVVDTPTGSIDPAPRDEPDERTRRDSFAARAQQEERIENLDTDLVPQSRGSIEYDADAPLIGRDAAVNGARTLKCKCGAMNLPTDWYCESCGNELVTL